VSVDWREQDLNSDLQITKKRCYSTMIVRVQQLLMILAELCVAAAT
jgi:hypothetical protein